MWTSITCEPAAASGGGTAGMVLPFGYPAAQPTYTPCDVPYHVCPHAHVYTHTFTLIHAWARLGLGSRSTEDVTLGLKGLVTITVGHGGWAMDGGCKAARPFPT